MVGGSICVYSSRSLQICPLINRDHSGSCGSMSEYESRGPVSALLRGARCGPGAPAPAQRGQACELLRLASYYQAESDNKTCVL